MQIDFAYQRSFPKFARYVKEEFPKLKSNIPIRRALRNWGKLSDFEIDNVLSWGFAPRIVIVSTFGLDDFPNTIQLGMDMVSQFEPDSSVTPLPAATKSRAVLKNARGQLVYTVGSAILYAFVGGNLRFIDKKSSSPKSAAALELMVSNVIDAFARDVYGGQLTSTI